MRRRPCGKAAKATETGQELRMRRRPCGEAAKAAETGQEA